MHLASITSQEENDKLEKYVKDFGEWIVSEFVVLEKHQRSFKLIMSSSNTSTSVYKLFGIFQVATGVKNNGSFKAH